MSNQLKSAIYWMVFGVCTLILAYIGTKEVDPAPGVALGPGCQDRLAPGAGWPEGNPRNVPTPAKTKPPVESVITITVEPVEEPAPAPKIDHRVLVYGASWCQYCQPMKGHVERLRKEGYTAEYRDLDEQPSEHVQTLPTTFFYEGEVFKEKLTRPLSYDELKEFLDATL